MTTSSISSLLSIKSLDEAGRFAGYASVFGIIDSQNDIVLRGAFEKSISLQKDIKLLWQHQFDEPVGVITRLFEDQHGLYVEGQLLLSVARGREAYVLLKSGAVSGLSIGYSPVHYSIDPVTDVRKISEVKLWEISLVTFPANAEAQITVVKSANDSSLRGACDEAIQNGSPRFARDDGEWKHATKTGQLIELHDAISRVRQIISYS